jgi:type IV pilus assembly protein PilY1
MTVGTGSTKTLSALIHVVSATGTIYSGKTISPTTITVQTNAAGAILAGRTSDADTTGRANLINWVRGQDNNGDENSNGSSADVRASVHGDVLHSRPAVINYNRNGDDNDVFAFYGANDGILHAVQGGFASNGGNEAWGFVASEFFGKLKRLRDNSPVIGTVSPASLRDYFFDGPISVYTKDVNSDGKLVASDGDKVYLFVGMRRGGRYIYALDVSDPANPKFLWKKGCPNLTDNTGCDTGYSEMGQTWSEPKVAFLKAYTNPVLIFGAGYDPAVEDFQPCLITSMPPDAAHPLANPTSVTAQTGGTVTYTSAGSCTYSGTTATTVNRSMGRGVFIVDATNGNVLFRFGPDASADKQVTGMQYAMPADLVVLNRDRDNTRALPGKENIQPLLSGYVDRVYSVDTGGNIWRLDLDSANTNNWVVTQFAAVSGTALTDKRKFLFPPDVLYSSDANGNYDAILIGSGDREHPFDSTVTNRYYMFKDRKTGLDATGQVTVTDTTFDSITAPNGLFDATSNCLQDTTVCNSAQQTLAQAQLQASRGWKVTLGAGEKTVGSSTTVAGTTLFNTNQPSASAGGGACGANLGIAREYLVNFQNATATTELNGVSGLSTSDRSFVAAGGGYLPSPVPVIVEIGGKKYQAVISGTQVQSPGGLKLEARIRTYWYRKIE